VAEEGEGGGQVGGDGVHNAPRHLAKGGWWGGAGSGGAGRGRAGRGEVGRGGLRWGRV
jgi:hypothetical protein